jgi:hypothetical protein
MSNFHEDHLKKLLVRSGESFIKHIFGEFMTQASIQKHRNLRISNDDQL